MSLAPLQRTRSRLWIHGLLLFALALVACGAAGSPDAQTPQPQATHPPLDPTYVAFIEAERDPNVPDLPFADNPDPNQCGIPIRWGSDDPAWLTGSYAGELIQPEVLLYDSHLRLDIAASAPHGSEVEVLLYQQNPVTDYYLVKIKGTEAPNEGWIPAPFLSFEPLR